jgi:hypothetical protein
MSETRQQAMYLFTFHFELNCSNAHRFGLLYFLYGFYLGNLHLFHVRKVLCITYLNSLVANKWIEADIRGCHVQVSADELVAPAKKFFVV